MRRSLALVLSSTLVLQVAPQLAAQTPRGVRARSVQSPVLPSNAGGLAQNVVPGAISGTAQSTSGQLLAGYTVRVRNLGTGEVAGSSTTNAAGGFSFNGLSPANYVIELVNPAGAVVGGSSPIAVAAGVTSTMTVGLTTAAAAAAAGGGLSTALVVASIAAAAGIAGVVVVAADASPSR